MHRICQHRWWPAMGPGIKGFRAVPQRRRFTPSLPGRASACAWRQDVRKGGRQRGESFRSPPVARTFQHLSQEQGASCGENSLGNILRNAALVLPFCCGSAGLSHHVLSKRPDLIAEFRVTLHHFRDHGAVRLEALPGTIDPPEAFLGEPDGCLDKCRDFLRKGHKVPVEPRLQWREVAVMGVAGERRDWSLARLKLWG